MSRPKNLNFRLSLSRGELSLKMRTEKLFHDYFQLKTNVVNEESGMRERYLPLFQPKQSLVLLSPLRNVYDPFPLYFGFSVYFTLKWSSDSGREGSGKTRKEASCSADCERRPRCNVICDR
jgi:hypothetical protein